MARKDALIREFAEERQRQLMDGRFDLVRADVRFLDPHTVQLSTGDQLRARHFVIATGSHPSPHPHFSTDAIPALTSDELIALPELPSSMVILGGGAIAVEFAQLLTRFGVQVTVIQRSAHVLRGFDTDVATVLEEVLQREGVRLFTGTELLSARLEAGSKLVEFRQRDELRTVQADEVLVAMGRTPNTRSLDLAKAGVRLDGERIRTDTQMRTSAPHIFAAGDCTGPHDVVHVAVQQGEIAGHNIAHAHKPREMDYRLLIQVVFTEPQAAMVGLSEAAARARGMPYAAASHRFDDHGKSLIMDFRDGFVKLLADNIRGEILGGICVGPSGGELIHEIVAAMYRHLTVTELALMPHYHPTLAEIWTYPAEELARKLFPQSSLQETLSSREGV
jgi:pyruvate/2-oxoglutarate dehydrogenase complex dihydrolipoamide dehydrogenase (E3) component